MSITSEQIREVGFIHHLADEAAEVARRLQPFGDGDFGERKRSLVVVLHPELLLVAAGEQARP